VSQARRFPSLTPIALLAGLWLLWRVRAPGDGDPPEAALSPLAPPVRLTVVIPARNEAEALPPLLASLADQSRPADEVIVVDDDSVDRTAVVALAGGARVVTAPPLPGGWVGKPWAAHHGAKAATGDLLLFLDADVTLAPGAVARLLAEHGRRGGLISVQPAHRTIALYEQLSAVCNVVAMMGTGAFSGPPARPPDMAFGPCLLIDRPDYDATGGHAHPTVRRQVAEDVALARRMRALGRPVTVRAGGEIVTFRMYPAGLRQLTDGWTKMIGNGARLTSPALTAAVVLWVTGALIGAGRGLSVTRALLRRRPTLELLPDAAIYGLWVAEMRWLFGRVGRWREVTAVLFPVPLVAFVVLVTRGLVLVARRRPATWRDRPVPAG
jgi:4,4'-diaponeurosporenoate glycosyltransferase